MPLPFEAYDRKVLVRTKLKPSLKFSKSPSSRSVEELLQSSVICLNKPSGPTSHQVADYVKKILNVDKVGHGGTLDPSPTGVLPLAINNASKVLQALLPAGKEYVALMYLHDDFSEDVIRKAISEYSGMITQLPPVKSAVKRELRERNIYYVDVLDIDGRHVLFRIGCQGGTYIRTYIHDLGKRLNSGAHMKELIRTKAGPFSYHDWVSLQDVKDAFEFYKNGDSSYLKKVLLPIESAVSHLPKIVVGDGAISAIAHGAPLYVGGIASVESCVKKGLLVAVFSLKDELVCMGSAGLDANEMISNEKGVALKPDRVFIGINVYPKE